MKKLTFALALVCAMSAMSAQAVEITSLPGGTVLTMPTINYIGSGPQDLAAGVQWSSDFSQSVYGYNGGYGFSSNGFWDSLTMIGTNSSTATMTLAFSTPVAAVGAFLNYAPGNGTATIGAYDANHALIESTNLTFQTSGGTNVGEFHGFKENSNLISYFTMTGAYLGATNITVSAVPEPGTYGMLLAGLGLLGMVARRRKA